MGLGFEKARIPRWVVMRVARSSNSAPKKNLQAYIMSQTFHDSGSISHVESIVPDQRKVWEQDLIECLYGPY